MRAPCGHAGEVVVGTYVRCIEGCEGAKPASGRGVVGHVCDCACVACRNCRRVAWFATRTKDGADSVKLYWGGKADGLAFQMYLPDAKIRHLNAVDADGVVVASHALSIDARVGDKLDFKFDPATLTFSSVKHWGKSRITSAKYDLRQLSVSKAEMDSWRERYAKLDLGIGWDIPLAPWIDHPPRGSTTLDLIHIATLVPGVERVEVASLEHGSADVMIKRVTEGTIERDVVGKVRKALYDQGPVGLRYRVSLETPGFHLQRACLDARMALALSLHQPRTAPMDAAKTAAKRVYRKLRKLGYTKGAVKVWVDDGMKTYPMPRVTVTLLVDNKKYGYQFGAYC